MGTDQVKFYPVVEGCLKLSEWRKFMPHMSSLYYNIIFKEFSEKTTLVRNASTNHCNWLWSAIFM